ncbi:PGF-pre-PGF domain-containing protein [Candidatus Woesearchaeota archaeon]|nr:PGF-pre-PGF domain-containing protein [Candidatus Woesearchaeota archaeon]
MNKIIFILLFLVSFLVLSNYVSAQCNGCLSNSQCFPIGSVSSQTYCDINNNFLNQKSLDSSCQNDFECLNSKCSNGKCIDLGIIFDQNEEKTSQIQNLIGFNVQETSPPTGGPGDGGGSSSGGLRTVRSFSNIKADTLTSASSTTDPVDNVIFKLKNNQRDVSVKINQLSALPGTVSKPVGIIYKSFEININLDNSIFSESKIRFKVNKRWLENNGYGKESIILKKLVSGWINLDTKYLSQDTLNYFYEADTNGFSIFSIVAEKTTSKVVNLCGNGIMDSSENCKSCSSDVRCQSDEICDNSGICQRKTQQIQQPVQQIEQPPIQETTPKIKTTDLLLKNYITVLIVGISILVLLIIAIVIYLMATRKPKYKEEPWEEVSENERRNYERLRNIIEENLSKGYSREQIKQGALDSGWDESLIDKVMRNIK